MMNSSLVHCDAVSWLVLSVLFIVILCYMMRITMILCCVPLLAVPVLFIMIPCCVLLLGVPVLLMWMACYESSWTRQQKQTSSWPLTFTGWPKTGSGLVRNWKPRRLNGVKRRRCVFLLCLGTCTRGFELCFCAVIWYRVSELFVNLSLVTWSCRKQITSLWFTFLLCVGKPLNCSACIRLLFEASFVQEIVDHFVRFRRDVDYRQ